MPVIARKNNTGIMWHVRTVCLEQPGIRIGLGSYLSKEHAHQVEMRYKKSGKIPAGITIEFRGVYEIKQKWFCEVNGKKFGPFKDIYEAAWHKRRHVDNSTQRMRRGTVLPVPRRKRVTKRERAKRNQAAEPENIPPNATELIENKNEPCLIDNFLMAYMRDAECY